MINHIRGAISAIEGSTITIDVHGIGIAVSVAQPELYSLEQKVQLATMLHWNQESGPHLYGFASELERQVFTLIISCSGIGPKIALAILGQMPAQNFLSTVAVGDVKALSSLKGIGLKKAESLTLQLQGKAQKLASTVPTFTENSPVMHIKNITEVLSSLHYSKPEITITLDHLKQQPSFATASFDDLLRKSLTFLAKNKHAS